MALNYDFDMCSVTPKTEDSDAPGVEGVQDVPVRYIARFRDAATVEALKRAPQAVQDYLLASRFGLEVHHSGAPAGRYPAADEAARIAVIEALAENVGKFDLPRADDSQPAGDGFHLPAFYAAVVEAEPIVMAPPPVPEIVPQTVAAEALPVDETPAPAPEIKATDPAQEAIAAFMADQAQAEPTDADPVEAFVEAAKVADAAPEEAAAPTPTGIEAAEPDMATPPPPRRFRLPPLPRWLTAGAAVAVIGVAFGTAII